MIPNRAPGTGWYLRRDTFDICVETAANDRVDIWGPTWRGDSTMITVSRQDARLLAKRINQCLDATVKK